jgi:hypothetical protein
VTAIVSNRRRLTVRQAREHGFELYTYRTSEHGRLHIGIRRPDATHGGLPAELSGDFRERCDALDAITGYLVKVEVL